MTLNKRDAQTIALLTALPFALLCGAALAGCNPPPSSDSRQAAALERIADHMEFSLKETTDALALDDEHQIQEIEALKKRVEHTNGRIDQTKDGLTEARKAIATDVDALESRIDELERSRGVAPITLPRPSPKPKPTKLPPCAVGS